MDKQQVRHIRDLVNQELVELGKRLNVKFEVGGASYDPNGAATFKLKVGVINAEGETYTVEKADFERYARTYGLQPSDLGREFQMGGHWYKIVGASRKARSYPILGQKIGTTQVFKFRPSDILRHLNEPARS